jgi:hypothetical protein
MLVMIDPFAERTQRVYVVHTRAVSAGDGNPPRIEEVELPGRFAFIREALYAYPGARISTQVSSAFARIAARSEFLAGRARARLRIATG